MDIEPIGMLFNRVEYYKPEDLKNIVDGMTLEQSIFFISESVEYASRSGLFSLIESEIVSKSLRLLVDDVNHRTKIDK